MSFVHEGDSIAAQTIFGVFENNFRQNISGFHGFPQKLGCLYRITHEYELLGRRQRISFVSPELLFLSF